MKKVNWFLFLFVVVFVSCSQLNCAIVSDNMSPATKKKIIAVLDNYPEGYESWTSTASKVVTDKTSPFYGFQRVFVNGKALKAYKTGEKYPEGSCLVLEFNEPISDGASVDKGDVVWIAVMTKEKSAINTGGWLYEAYSRSETVAVKKDMDVIAGCYNCHTAMEKKDYIFSSPNLP